MKRRFALLMLLGSAGAAMLSGAALAIETTYGEDPVPSSRCYDGFIDLGYGIDPIPAKSLSVRWREFRASRGKAVPPYHWWERPPGERHRSQIEQAPQSQRPSSRRAYQGTTSPRR